MCFHFVCTSTDAMQNRLLWLVTAQARWRNAAPRGCCVPAPPPSLLLTLGPGNESPERLSPTPRAPYGSSCCSVVKSGKAGRGARSATRAAMAEASPREGKAVGVPHSSGAGPDWTLLPESSGLPPICCSMQCCQLPSDESEPGGPSVLPSSLLPGKRGTAELRGLPFVCWDTAARPGG